VHAVGGWPGQAVVEKTLWSHAERHTPHAHVDRYTQAIMDLGATVCTRARPACERCPLTAQCRAYREGRVSEYPTPRPRTARRTRHTTMLILTNEHHEVLLERRPPTGVWGGLWSLPEAPAEMRDRAQLTAWCRDRLHCGIEEPQEGTPIEHAFTHFTLHIRPVSAQVIDTGAGIMEGGRYVWYNGRRSQARGLAAPVMRLLTHAAIATGEEE
jgi:A/G-specific adenine glycosylase